MICVFTYYNRGNRFQDHQNMRETGRDTRPKKSHPWTKLTTLKSHCLNLKIADSGPADMLFEPTYQIPRDAKLLQLSALKSRLILVAIPTFALLIAACSSSEPEAQPTIAPAPTAVPPTATATAVPTPDVRVHSIATIHSLFGAKPVSGQCYQAGAG